MPSFVILPAAPETRAARQALIATHFPWAAANDPAFSQTPGGRSAAQRALVRIEPERYARTRNFLDGAVTRLSPYIRHGVLSLGEVRRFVLRNTSEPYKVEKLIQELAWRDYWRRIYAEIGNRIWDNQEAPKRRWRNAEELPDLPADIQEARTGLACMDGFVTELVSTGYLHNHARMWFASFVIHWRRVAWQAAARFFLRHLLDGDPASNNLSFQWVSSHFGSKPYIFNRENLEKYTAGKYCQGCARRDDCPFDATYEALDARLFEIGGAQ